MAARRQSVLVSGIKPTGTPHLGNLIGMLRPAANAAQRVTSFLFVADLHALTTLRDGTSLRGYVYDDVATLLALGVDPERTTIFRQSDIPEIPELAWVLGCLTPTGMLQRAHAYKAARAEPNAPTLGLFSYPVLMAADILALGGTVVPVGSDQLQHLEMTRDLARRFNHAFHTQLPLPRATGNEMVAPLPGLDGRKMSKRYGNTIPITASAPERRELVGRIVTDSRPMGAHLDPDGSPVIEILRHFEDPAVLRGLADDLRTGRAGWAVAKERLAEALDRDVEPIRCRLASIRANEGYLEAVLRSGSERARARSAEVLQSVRKRVGIGCPSEYVADGNGLGRLGQLAAALAMTFPDGDPIAVTATSSAKKP